MLPRYRVTRLSSRDSGDNLPQALLRPAGTWACVRAAHVTVRAPMRKVYFASKAELIRKCQNVVANGLRIIDLREKWLVGVGVKAGHV